MASCVTVDNNAGYLRCNYMYTGNSNCFKRPVVDSGARTKNISTAVIVQKVAELFTFLIKA